MQETSRSVRGQWPALAPVCLSVCLSTLVVGVLAGGCGSPADVPASEPTLVGTWRAVLESPGGELPFTLELSELSDPGERGDVGAALEARLVNGPETLTVDRVEVAGSALTLSFEGYDSEIQATLDASGDALAGEWKKVVPEGFSRLPFRAERGRSERFEPLEGAVDSVASETEIAGRWEVEFTDEDGSEPAIGEFYWNANELLGTFLTPTGDYRFLAGSFENSRLRLSTFDGAHAFLFDATLDSDGHLAGGFWSRDTYHATWTARRLADDETAELPNAWELAKVTHPEGRFRFAFPDLEGNLVDQDDPRFAGKPLLINVFGSWCPNCNDEAPLLAEWHRRYQDRDLAVVGLAFEFSGDFERDARQVERYGERHGIEFPLLVAGVSDKQEAAAALPDLDVVIAYPTTIFVQRDGSVLEVHSGFAGPGTGQHHEELKLEMEQLIEQIL